jgi:hypothetical protein
MPDKHTRSAPDGATLTAREAPAVDDRGKPVAPLTPAQREWLESVTISRSVPPGVRFSCDTEERLAAFDEDTAAHDWAEAKLSEVPGPEELMSPPDLPDPLRREIRDRVMLVAEALASAAPQPQHDCPPCPECSAPCGSTIGEAIPGGQLRCAACGHDWTPTAAELEQALAADRAWVASEEPSS